MLELKDITIQLKKDGRMLAEGFSFTFTVERLMIFPPIAPWMATSNCWRGMRSLSFTQMAFA